MQPPARRAAIPLTAASGEEPFVDTGPIKGPPDFVVLDIGGNVGALIVYTDQECLGREIDLTPKGMSRSHHTHTMVRRRKTLDHEVIVGVYPELVAGSYTLWGLDGRPLGDVVIEGGQVTEYQAGNCGASTK
ncbi:MAG: hypothetical protein ACYC1D_02290 [Acidimicrobiales bacterium]